MLFNIDKKSVSKSFYNIIDSTIFLFCKNTSENLTAVNAQLQSVTIVWMTTIHKSLVVYLSVTIAENIFVLGQTIKFKSFIAIRLVLPNR